MKSEIGFDNLIWFIGIVENENDPAKHGRVQVRCFGVHPPANSPDVITDDLPWAPVTNAGHGGTVLPTKGDWVWGAFMDGRDAQHPFVIGIIPGMNSDSPVNSGSSDLYTKASKEAFDNILMPPMPLQQSGEDLETTQHALQAATKMEFAPASKADGTTNGRPIHEPSVPFSTQPHRNAVWKSRNSNSYVQVSEEDGKEHIVLSHESGAHVQIDTGGNIKIKSFGDMYSLSEGHLFEGARGAKTLTVEGPYNMKCKNATFEVEGDMFHTVTGNYNLNVGGKFAVSVGQSFEIAGQRISLEAVSEHINIKSAEKIKMGAGDNISLGAGADVFLQAAGNVHEKSGGTFQIASGGATDFVAGGNFNVDASEAYINSGTATEATDTPETAVSPKIEKPVKQKFSIDSTFVTTTPSSIGVGDVDSEDTS